MAVADAAAMVTTAARVNNLRICFSFVDHGQDFCYYYPDRMSQHIRHAEVPLKFSAYPWVATPATLILFTSEFDSLI